MLFEMLPWTCSFAVCSILHIACLEKLLVQLSYFLMSYPLSVKTLQCAHRQLALLTQDSVTARYW